MGREGPEDVFLAANLSEIQSIGIDVLDASQLSGIDQLFELENGRMVPQQVAHHQNALPLSRKTDQRASLVRGRHNGFSTRTSFPDDSASRSRPHAFPPAWQSPPPESSRP